MQSRRSTGVGKLLKDVHIISESAGIECDLAKVDDTGKILNLDAFSRRDRRYQRSLGASAFTGYTVCPKRAPEIMPLGRR